MTATLAALSPRTRMLLETPVLPMLFRLGAPNLGEALARVAFITADAIFVSWLGPDALAGVSVVFPLFLVLQTVTAAGIGAGVAAAIGRALGAGELPRARAIAGTAVAMALLGAAATTVALILDGPALYAAMGLDGAALAMAVDYGALVFGGSVFVWLMNILANICRGAGTMVVPATAIAIGELFHLALSPALIVGWGPLPRLGIEGAAIAVLAAYAVGALILAVHLFSPRALVRLEPGLVRMAWTETKSILAVGAFAAGSAVQFFVVGFLVAGLLGRLGTASIAAYGAAQRLELLQLPISFAFGSAIVTMVATAIGAGNRARAQRIAGAGMLLSAAIGLPFTLAALAGRDWMGLFTADPAIRDLGALYLLCQAPAYPIFGAGLAAYFACQGAGAMGVPFLLCTLRLVIAVGGGWGALILGASVLPVFLASAAGLVALGLGMLAIASARFRISS